MICESKKIIIDWKNNVNGHRILYSKPWMVALECMIAQVLGVESNEDFNQDQEYSKILISWDKHIITKDGIIDMIMW